MKQGIWGALIVAGLGLMLTASAARAEVQYKIVTASERGTYIQIGRDLATYVAPEAGIELESLPSAGSAENVRRLRFEPGVKFALVQSDVFQAFLDQAASGNYEAGRIISPLRVILPLYNEEIYFLVRADSELNFVHEIKDARINAGALGSGTALTTVTLYRQMFGTTIPESKVTHLTNEDALVKLITDKTIDVVAVIAGQPAKLLADMKPEAKELLKLLKFDASNPVGRAALKTYFPATVRATSYPNLLNEDIPGLAVKAFLVTYDYRLPATGGYFVGFARSLCRNFGELQTKGHPKWREVQLELPALGQRWEYFAPTTRELRSCIAARPVPRPVKSCSQQERVLGLCD